MSADVVRAPGRWPGLGHLVPLLRDPLRFVRSLQGLAPVVRVDLGRLPMYFLTRPELVHQVLVDDSRKYDRGRYYDRARQVAGNGLITSDRSVHRVQRPLMQPAFHQARIREYSRAMQLNAQAAAESWAPGQTVRMDEEMHRLALTTVTSTLFAGERSRTEVAAVHRSLPVFAQGLLVRTFTPQILERAPLPFIRRFNAAATELRSALEAIVQRYQADSRDGGDLLSMLVAVRDPETGRGMDDGQLCDELVTILIAGTETSGTALGWALHHLAEQPGLQARVQAELDSVLGGRPIGSDDLRLLPYLGRVVDEVTRLHTPELIMRRSNTPVELGGHALPAGSEVAFSYDALYRDPDVYADPLRFDPDRWLRTPAGTLPKGAFAPFGEGQRKCIGDVFAVTAMTIDLATILARWNVESAPGHLVREVPASMVQPDSLPMTVRPRTA